MLFGRIGVLPQSSPVSRLNSVEGYVFIHTHSQSPRNAGAFCSGTRRGCHGERVRVECKVVLSPGAPSVVRHRGMSLTRAWRARVTFSRISLADLVQMKGFGSALC